MSQSRKIAKNVLRQNINFMEKNTYDGILGGMARNGITLQDMAREVSKVRKETYESTATAVQQVAYAAIAIVLAEEFGFSKEDCYKAINAVDRKMALAIDYEDIIKEMEDKAKVRFNFSNGVERVEML